VEIKGMPEVGFTVYISIDSDQPGAKRSFLLVKICRWFDEKDTLFGEVANIIDFVGGEMRKL
jgi:hypothetical protein